MAVFCNLLQCVAGEIRCLSSFCLASLSLSHTHIHTYTHTHTHTFVYTLSTSIQYTHSQTHTLTHIFTITLSPLTLTLFPHTLSLSHLALSLLSSPRSLSVCTLLDLSNSPLRLASPLTCPPSHTYVNYRANVRVYMEHIYWHATTRRQRTSNVSAKLVLASASSRLCVLCV